MKNLIILGSAVMLFITACSTDKIRDYIPGTYVSHVTGEYSISDDTLIIEPVGNSDFIIYRKTGFQRINDGKKGNPEYETEQWQAIYDEATKSIQQTNKGKRLTFYPDEDQLRLGKRAYSKTK